MSFYKVLYLLFYVFLHVVILLLFFPILYLTSIDIIFKIYNFIYIVLITFAIETN